jgi:hypothetical protein
MEFDSSEMYEAINSAQPLKEKNAVATAFVVVAEWMDEGGSRWLTMSSGNAAGDDLPTWTIAGLLHSSLYDGFPEQDEE